MKDSPSRPKPAPAATEPSDLEFQTSLVRAINEASPDGILVVDGKHIVVSHNQRFLDVWRIPNEQVRHNVKGGAAAGTLDQPLLSMIVERVKDVESFLRRVRELYVDATLSDHSEVELKDGRTLERHSTGLRGEGSTYLGRIWFFRDITARKQAESALRGLAERDSLTGVANRRYFLARCFQEMARARRHGRPLSLTTMDVDHFKRINDGHGHAAGDEVLKQLCATFGRGLRDFDLLGRLGGEEFAVLLPDTALEGARAIAERLRLSVAGQKVRAGLEELTCTISAGVASMLTTDASIDDTLRRADEALYRAKNGGRNRVEVGV